jgi:hypothetical protein
MMASGEWLAFRIFRLLFFGLLALDELIAAAAPTEPSALLMSKVPLLFEEGLDWVPTPKALSHVHAVACLAAIVASVGTDSVYKHAAVAAAACYNFAYWANAIDGYQHHYLLCLLLALLPWARDHGWVRRLITVQLAIVYFWTTVAKLADGGLFLEGHFVRMTARRRGVYDGIHDLSVMTGIDELSLWSLFAVQVVVAEILLVVLLLTGRAPWLAIAIGAAMHLGFQVVGNLSIGYFSWYMIVLYILLVPVRK